MVALAQALTAAQVRDAALMHRDIHTATGQARDHEVARVITVGDEHLTALELPQELPQQGGFTGLYALARTRSPGPDHNT